MTDTDKMVENGTATTYQGTLEMNTNYTSGHYQCQFNSERTVLEHGLIYYNRGIYMET